MKQSTIINKLKKQIATKGYCENLGQDDVRKFKEWAFNTHPYKKASELCTSLESAIDTL